MDYEIDYNASALVFNIQTYCIHDGPGIRTTVFVKGCPLKCIWCANPESNLTEPQLMTYSSKCTGCGRCLSVCPQQAICLYMDKEQEKVYSVTDRTKCVNCGACVSACYQEAREIAGTRRTVRDVIDQVKRDKLFFDGSGGGVTISGGEALMFPDFSANLFAAAHAEGIHTAIETSSFATPYVVDRVFQHVDLGLLDVKHMDSALHKKYTGVGNEQILANIRHVACDLHVPVIIRVPTIPGCNDDEKNIAETAKFALDIGAQKEHLLPYHRLGERKRDSLGQVDYFSVDPPSDEHMENLRMVVERVGMPCQIGG